MTKTKRMIIENVSLVDIVIELLDARTPYSSKNPDIDIFAKNKKRIVVFNKVDLADKETIKKWCDFYKNKNIPVLLINSITGSGIKDLEKEVTLLMAEKVSKEKAKGRINTSVRCMVVGIPNVGKSTFINKIVGKAVTKTEDRPGVTRGKQWIKIKKDILLLDTPGILWPKFEDKNVALNLAFIGAINDKIMDTYTLCLNLINKLREVAKEDLIKKYAISFEDDEANEIILEKIALKRGYILKGAMPDLERTSIVLIDEFRAGKIARVSLEAPLETM